MLKAHMDAKENALVAISKIPANTGHALHKGTPREAFIKEFLESHLPANVAIGTGEIIDANSKPNVQRNQFDIVIYKRTYPKLDFGGGIGGFLIESVIATVEVKSTLTQKDMEQSIKAAKNSKSLIPNVTTSFHTGYIPPKILNYVIAYDGPASMQTVYNWIPPIHSSLGVSIQNLPQNDEQRINTASPSIDGVFVLNKGFIYFDNVPFGFADQKVRSAQPDLKWVIADTGNGNLLLFFLFLQTATANIEGKWLNALPYLQGFQVPSIGFGKA
jgi:hypothetical protein